jgi:hypothetical protein
MKDEQMIKEKAVFDRTAQLENLKLDVDAATTRAHQDGVAMADVILCLLHRTDALCEQADETGADISRVQGAFEMGAAHNLSDDVIQGAVVRKLRGDCYFLKPDNVALDDYSQTVFCHAQALQRCGISAENVSLGTRLSFRTKEPRHAGARREAYEIELLPQGGAA